jgi:hypothetical protein
MPFAASASRSASFSGAYSRIPRFILPEQVLHECYRTCIYARRPFASYSPHGLVGAFVFLFTSGAISLIVRHFAIARVYDPGSGEGWASLGTEPARVGLRSSMSTKAVPKLSLRLAVFGPMAAALLLASSARAQSPATQTQAESNPRSPVPAGRLVTQALDETQRVSLDGTVHPLAQARFDQGAVPDSFPANRMLLILNRAPDREAALQQFLADVHTQGSASFHKWLTPAQFGALYGPADSDIQTAKSWLTSHGFQVSRVTAGKQFVEFFGTAA